MAVLWLDLETYSNIPITHGAHRYAEEAEVLLVALADDQDPVGVWDCTLPENADWRTRLQQRIDAAERVIIHNSPFDRTVLRHRGVHIPVEKIEDTMILALQHALPASLGMLCDVLNVEQDKAKDKAGKKLIQLFTKPRPKNMKLRRATRETHPDEWEAFIEYARLDVDAMRDVYRRLPRWNDSDSERHLWRLDQRINDRGVAVDLDLARSALRAFQRTTGTLAARISELTGGAIGSATQRQKLLDYMRDDCDLAADDLTKSTVGNLLRGDLDERARELLNMRQQAAATSPAKYKVLLQSTSADGRLRGTIQFCGASRTGRDAGRIFQPQNLPRPSLDASTIDMGIEAMKLDCEDLLFDNVSDLCTSAIRGALVAEPKHKLVVADLSNIEGRVLAWLAGEEWKLKAFRDFDAGIGHDLYVMAYAQSFQISPEEVVHNKKYGDGSMRQIGKVQELACFGPDTQVLTSNGIKPIIKVDEDDLLWDGVEWVTHQGLVNKGIRPVMELDGVLVTPDHQVLARGTWLSAQTVASSPNCLGQALATGKASLWWLALTSGQQGDLEPSVSNVLAERLRMKSRSATGVKEQAPAVIGAQRKPAPAGVKSGMATLTSAQTPRIAGDCATVYPPVSTGATTHAIAPTTTTAAGASTFTNLGERIDALFSGISSRLMDGINLNSSLTELMSTGVTSLTISASSVGALTVTTCDVFQTSNDASTNSSVVYDIAHAGPRNRFTILTDSGALVVHNCGYQGGAGAFIKMGGTIAEHLGEDRIQEIVQAWRRAHPATKSFWYDMEGAAKMAIRDPGASYSARLITFVAKKDQMGTDWLLMRLPSGRSLCYRNASVDRESGQILYEGVNQYTRKWSILETYGGKLVENCVQAVARDVFMSGLKRAEAAGYAVCLRVHDELICETPDEPRFLHEELAALMATNPHWAPMLPLAAAGFETHRYRKD